MYSFPRLIDPVHVKHIVYVTVLMMALGGIIHMSTLGKSSCEARWLWIGIIPCRPWASRHVRGAGFGLVLFHVDLWQVVM